MCGVRIGGVCTGHVWEDWQCVEYEQVEYVRAVCGKTGSVWSTNMNRKVCWSMCTYRQCVEIPAVCGGTGGVW